MGVTNFDEVQLDHSRLLDGDGNQIVGEQQEAIVVAADANEAAVRTGLRAVISALEAHGLLAEPDDD